MINKKIINKGFRYLKREVKFLIIKKPYFLNFPAATICNHKCVMCNIHEIKERNEMNMVQLEETLKDPLFSSVESVGLSGGEPFMKKDLLELVETSVKNLPSLVHFSINSNGHLPENISKKIPKIKAICEKKGVNFNMVLSMDGVGEVHSEVRGKKSAWEHLERSFKLVQQNGMTPSTLMTIHRRNYNDVFNVYYYCLKNNITPYFGIATIIERLGNEFKYDNFNLDLTTKYYIWEFLQNLAYEGDFMINKRIWYSLLSDQLLYDYKRTASCVAQDKGVYLSDAGEVSYCGVYDKELVDYGSQNLYQRFKDRRNNKLIRQRMIEKHCNSCMHDYQSKPKAKDLFYFIFNNSKISKVSHLISSEITIALSNKKVTASNNNHLLYGWWGTETIGDKAIYGQILSELLEKNVPITIATYKKQYTERTLIELGLFNHNQIELIEVKDLLKSNNTYHKAIYCGGPIMGYSNLYDFLRLSRKALKSILYGVGLSEIKETRYQRISKKLIREADQILVRDEQSKLKASEITPKTSIASAIDPAFIYVNDFVQQHKKQQNEQPVLGISFRALNNKFATDKQQEYIEIYAKVANDFISKTNGSVVLVPMNSYYVGGDDRFVLKQIEDLIEDKSKVKCISHAFSINDIMSTINECDYFIGTRFHSSVFALASGIPTIGVDYENHSNGKIQSLFKTFELEEYQLSLAGISYDKLKSYLDKIITEKDIIKQKIHIKNKVLMNGYKKINH